MHHRWIDHERIANPPKGVRRRRVIDLLDVAQINTTGQGMMPGIDHSAMAVSSLVVTPAAISGVIRSVP